MSMFAFVQKTALYDLENVNRAAHMTSSLQYTQDQEWLLPSHASDAAGGAKPKYTSTLESRKSNACRKSSV